MKETEFHRIVLPETAYEQYCRGTETSRLIQIKHEQNCVCVKAEGKNKLQMLVTPRSADVLILAGIPLHVEELVKRAADCMSRCGSALPCGVLHIHPAPCAITIQPSGWAMLHVASNRRATSACRQLLLGTSHWDTRTSLPVSNSATRSSQVNSL